MWFVYYWKLSHTAGNWVSKPAAFFAVSVPNLPGFTLCLQSPAAQLDVFMKIGMLPSLSPPPPSLPPSLRVPPHLLTSNFPKPDDCCLIRMFKQVLCVHTLQGSSLLSVRRKEILKKKQLADFLSSSACVCVHVVCTYRAGRGGGGNFPSPLPPPSP